MSSSHFRCRAILISFPILQNYRRGWQLPMDLILLEYNTRDFILLWGKWYLHSLSTKNQDFWEIMGEIWPLARSKSFQQRQQAIHQRLLPAEGIGAAAELFVVDTVAPGLEEVAQVAIADQYAGSAVGRGMRFEQADIQVEAHGDRRIGGDQIGEAFMLDIARHFLRKVAGLREDVAKEIRMA